MKAIVGHRYGSPDGLSLQDVDTPVVKDHEVLIRVHAASVNPADWHGMTGTPYVGRLSFGLRRPHQPIPGIDVAGQVEAVGAKVTRFQPGDEVFGLGSGSLAEYACAHEDKVVLKPADLTWEQAAAVPIAALTALQGLRDRGRIRSGQYVLVNGASGGVGTFAVQIAKAFGADVTAVCSTRNVEAVRALGADRVIDYTRLDFVRCGQRFDLIFDVAGNRSIADRKRVLTPSGTVVMVGGPKTNRWVGPMTVLPGMLLASLFSRQRMVAMLAKGNTEDLTRLVNLLTAGKVTPVIERTYSLADAPEAFRCLGAGHAQGKLVVTV